MLFYVHDQRMAKPPKWGEGDMNLIPDIFQELLELGMHHQ
jgi:hypothetical protein